MSSNLLFSLFQIQVLKRTSRFVNATVLLGNNRGCFRIVIVDDSDPEPAENFTISFVVSKVQPEGVNISINQSEAVIIIQENDRKTYWYSLTVFTNVSVGTVKSCTHCLQSTHAGQLGAVNLGHC